jgi:hypothetical protein
MDDQAPNLKRRRSDDDAYAEIRDRDLYFEDGRVILSANDCDGNVIYFRIHMSVLRENSPIFGDMFSIPMPTNTCKTMRLERKTF